MNLISKKVIKSKTNDNEFAKQYLYLLSDIEKDTTLIVHKFVLVTEHRLKVYNQFGFETLKQYNDKYLVKQVFSIKLKTLVNVFDWLGEINKSN